MKFLVVLAVAAGFGLLGYYGYPQIHDELVGRGWIDASEKRAKDAADEAAPSAVGPLLADEELPERVRLKVPVVVASADGEVQRELDAGYLVSPVRVDGELLVISPTGSPLEGMVSVADTDLAERLAELRASRPQVAPSEPAEVAVPEEIFAVESTDESAEPTDEPAEPTVEATPESQPIPVVPQDVLEAAAEREAAAAEAMAEAAQEGAAQADDAPAPVAASDAEAVVAEMQASVRRGEVTEFGFDQVQQWEATGEEVIRGRTFQTGIASFEATTIFGTQTMQAKALLENGRVVHWMWAQSGLAIK